MIVSFAWPSSYHRTGGVVALYNFANGLARMGQEVHFIHGPAWPDRIGSVDELAWFPFEPAVQHHIVDTLDDASLPDGDVFFAADGPTRLGLPTVFIQGAGMLAEHYERHAFRCRAPKVCVARWLVDLGLTYGVPEEQLWYVPMGIDHELFAVRTPDDERPFDVAMLFNEHPTKGWGVGWEALKDAKRRVPDLRAVIFGVTTPPRSFEDWVEFRLAPDHHQLAREVYNAARVFVQSSYQEGFGFTAVEAMACGAALVTTDNGGSRDYAVHGETAWVVRAGDARGLADGIVTLLRDDRARRTLASAGEQYVRRFEWSLGAATLAAHLEEYVADPARFQQPPADDIDRSQVS